MKNIFRFTGGYLFATIIIIVFILLNGFIPKTLTGWILIIVFGFPIWLLGEWAGSKITGERVSKSISSSKKAVSLARLLYLLLVMLIFLLIGFLMWKYMGTLFKEHFRVI